MREKVAALFEIPEDAPRFEQALTHPSFTNESKDAPDNQRLEFLGDSVLGLCTSELLFERFPEADEGTLTRIRSQLVSTDNLADWGRREGVADAIRLGRGAVSSGLRESTNVVADAVEACLAAVFLERGLDAARVACVKIVGPSLDQLGAVGGRDPKSEIQEDLQAKGLGLPVYDVTNSGGPAHDRWFEVTLLVKGQALAIGRGRSKRLAERAAAEVLLAQRDELLAPFIVKAELPIEGETPTP